MVSITTWVRLEPQSRDAGMTDGLKAEVRDPLWLLARQWQIGEFAGHDAGSPTQASYRADYAPLTGYAPTATPAPTPIPIDPGLPLEVHVERETVSLGPRAAVQLGLRFERLIRQSTIPNAGQLVADFRAAPRYAIPPDPPAPPYDQVPDPAGTQFNAAVYGRVTDGWALYTAAKATLPNPPPGLPPSAQAVFAQLLPILTAFVAYGDSLYSTPTTTDSAWSPHPPSSTGACEVGWLHYDFSIGSQSDMNDLALRALEFPGGHLDWYDFSASTGSVDIPHPATATVDYRTIMPTHVTFRGMPTGSWWTFEDGLTDYGQLTADLVDQAMLLVTEFAIDYGGNWFTVPVQLPYGALAQVSLLLVTDTFGQRTLIRPTGTQLAAGQNPWAVFTISGEQAGTNWLLLPPTLGAVQDGPPLEVVDFLRDDAAALCWAVERTLQGPLDAPVDGYEWYLQRIKHHPPPTPSAAPGDPDIAYLLGTTVPDNWIPLLPEQSATGSPQFLRRGAMVRPNPAPPPATLPVPPHGQILQPANPFFLRDQAVSQTGLQVQRYFRRTRWTDGSTHVWMARRVLPGHGPGASGLAFDVVIPTTPSSESR
jgi:hypothetical protein